MRAGDYIDTHPSGIWYDRIIAAKATQGRISYPGDPDAPHAWACLPDLAKAAVSLVEKRDALSPFEDILFPGFTLSGRELAEATGRALGHEMTLKRMSWLPIALARPFWPMAKHLIEMRYLWSMPHGIADDRLRKLCPDLPETPLTDALIRALQHQIDPDQPVA